MINEMGQPKSYEIPGDLMEKIVKIISGLPYGQVAPVANQIGKIIVETNERARMGNAKEPTSKTKETG